VTRCETNEKKGPRTTKQKVRNARKKIEIKTRKVQHLRFEDKPNTIKETSKYTVSHASGASRNLPLKTDHHQSVYFRLPDVVTIGVSTSLEPRHPLEKNLGQSPLFEGPQNVIDRREQSLPGLE
jgi:hypothetical protein